MSSSRSLSEVTTPAMIVLAEATWFSLLVDAVANYQRANRVSLSFLAIALPALAAASVGSLTARLHRWRWRAPVIVPAAIVGAALSAGVISELSRPGSFAQVASDPWAAHGHRVIVITASAWAVAAATWLRGSWLALKTPALRDVGSSVAVSALAFLGIIIGRTAGGPGEFRAATHATGWLILLWCPLAVAALALVRERDLERTLLHRARSQPSAVWFGVLTGPMVAVGLVALLLAATLGPLGSLVGRGFLAVVSVFHFTAQSHMDAVRIHALPTSAPRQAVHGAVATAHHASNASSLLSILVIGVLGVLALLAVIQWVRRPRASRIRVADNAVGEERDSLFSWRHLGRQLRAAVSGLLSQRRRPPVAAVIAPAAVAPEPAGPESVRRAYRRMLHSARVAGQPRAAAETTREFEQRMAGGPAREATAALTRLTALYEDVRYGEEDDDPDATASAVAHADLVTAAIAPAPGGPPVTGP